MSREPFIKNDSSFMILSDWSDVTAGITTRHGGASQPPYESLNLGFHVGDDPGCVLENRRGLAGKIDVPLDQWVCAEQVHGSHIEKVTRNDGGKGAKALEGAIPETDGLYTSEVGVLLTLGYADCVPLYFFAPRYGTIGIAHAGWRGTTANIAGKMIERWVNEEKIPHEEIQVAIGPSIGECCYEVDQRVIGEVQQALGPEANSVYRQIDKTHFRLNLKECNRRLCLQAGIPENLIETSLYCTGCCQDIFYSHRQENGKTGRMMGFIGFKD